MKPEEYDLYYETFDFFSREPFASPNKELFIKYIAKALPEEASVVKAGAGAGIYTQKLQQARSDLKLTVIEPSRQLMDLTRQRFSRSTQFINRPLEKSLEIIRGKDALIFMDSPYTLYDSSILHASQGFFQEVYESLNEGAFLFMYESSLPGDMEATETELKEKSLAAGVEEDFNRFWPLYRDFLQEAKQEAEAGEKIGFEASELDSRLKQSGFEKIMLWDRFFIYRKPPKAPTAQNSEIGEYYYFTEDDSTFLLNVGKSSVFQINPRLVDLVERARQQPSILNDDNKLYAALQSLELINNQDCSTESQNVFYPTSVLLNVCQDCMLSCVYCYGFEGQYGSRGFMDTATAYKTVDWLMEKSGDKEKLNITFFGGEPLLNYELIQQVIAYGKTKAEAYGKKLYWGITTNGILLDEDKLAFFKANRVGINLSYDGYLQDRQRPFKSGEATGDILKSKLELIKSFYNDELGVIATATVADPCADLALIRKELRDSGCEGLNLRRASSISLPETDLPTRASEFNALADSPDFIKLFINDLQQQHGEILRLIKERKTLFSRELMKMFSLLLTQMKRSYFCGAGKSLFAVAYNGDIYPCHRFNGCEGAEMGNVHESFDPAFMERYVSLAVDQIESCKSCWSRYFCAGGCLYDTYDMQEGKVNPPEHLCDLYKAQLKTALKVFLELDHEDTEFLKDALKLALEDR